MSEDHNYPNIPAENYASNETVPVEPITRLDFITQRFYFHEEIKSTPGNKHYIVEDMEVDPLMLNDPDAPLFFYLKQMTFDSQEKFLEAKKFYIKLLNYCKTPFAKNDIVRLNFIFEFNDKENNYAELIIVMDYGESDRIDVKNISSSHISKFLKNICVLLDDIKKFDSIYHSNIFLENIILVNNELKLSGFKPRYASETDGWENQISKEYGVNRLDLYLIGLLWLVFQSVQLDDLTLESFSLEEVKTKINELLDSLPETKKNNIILKLLDLDSFPALTLDDVILSFDEYYILENIKIEEIKTKENMMSSIDRIKMRQSKAKGTHSRDNNLFLNSYQESETDAYRFNNDQQTAKLYDSRNPEYQQGIKIEGADFTLRDNNSIDPNRIDGPLIDVKIGENNPHNISDLEVDLDTMEIKKKKGSGKGISNRHNSVQNLLENEEENRKQSFRNIKSNAQFNNYVGLSINREEANKSNNDDKDSEDNNDSDISEEVPVYSYRNMEKISDSYVDKKDELKADVTEVRNSFDVKTKEEPIINNEDEKRGMVKPERTEVKRTTDHFKKKTPAVVTIEQHTEAAPKEVEIQKESSQTNKSNSVKANSQQVEIESTQSNKYSNYQIDIPVDPKFKGIFGANMQKAIFRKTDKKSASIMLDLIGEEKEEEPVAYEPVVEQVIEKQESELTLGQQSESQQNPNESKISKVSKTSKRKKKKVKSQQNSMISTQKSNMKKKQSLKEQTKGIKPIKKSQRDTLNNTMNDEAAVLKNLLETGGDESELQPIQEEEPPKSEISKKMKKKPWKPKPRVATKSKKTFSIEEMNKRMKKQLINSSTLSRKNMFHYNIDTQNKNISFKQVLKSVKIVEKKKDGVNESIRNHDFISEGEEERRKEFIDIAEGNDEVEVRNIENEHIKDLSAIQVKPNTYIVPHAVQNNSAVYQTGGSNEFEKKEDELEFDFGSNDDIIVQKEPQQSNTRKKKPKKKKTKVKNLLNNFEPSKTDTMLNITQGSIKRKSYIGIINEKKEGNDFGYYSKTKNKGKISEVADKIGEEEPVVKTIKTISIQDASIENMSKEELNSFIDEDEFQEKIEEIQVMFDDQKYDECLYNLTTLVNEVGGINKVDVYRMISMVYHKMKNYKQSMINLGRCASYIQKNHDLPDKEELQKSVLISYTVSQIENKEYQAAIKTLNHKVFRNKDKVPFPYFTLLGDARRELGFYSDAYEAYNQQLNKYISKEMDAKTIKSLFVLVNKIMISLDSIKDDKQMVKFYRHALILIDGFIKVDATYLKKSEEYMTIKEHILLTILGVLANKSNFNMINYILDDIIKNDLVVYDNLKQEDKVKFCDFYLNFAFYLKKQEDYGGQKQAYIKFLDQSLYIIQMCESDNDILKKELLIIFNQGLYYLQQKEFEQAKEAFEGSMRVYNNKNTQPDSEFFIILYNIGLSLYNLEKYEDSSYFFEKIIKANFEENRIFIKTLKTLSKIYYRLGMFEKSFSLLQGWIYNNLGQEEKEAQNFYVYLSIYNLSAIKVFSNDFEEVLAQLRTNIELTNDVIDIHYFNIFYNISYPSFRNKNYSENEIYLDRLFDIIRKESGKKFIDNFVPLINKLYFRYALDKNEDHVKDSNYIIKALKSNNLSIEDNAKEICKFLSNFVFLIMNSLPIDPHKERDFDYRDELINSVKRLKESDKLYRFVLKTLNKHVLADNEKNKIQVVIKDQKPNTFKKTDSEIAINFVQSNNVNVNKGKKNTRRKSKIKKKQEPKPEVTRMSKEESRAVIINSNLEDKTKCICNNDNVKERDILDLIKSFLKQIKNMLFLGITEDVQNYFAEFEDIIKEKGLRWDKYIFIKNLFNFYFNTQNSNLFDSDAFSNHIESIVNDTSLCIHDYKLIVVFLESFRDPAYLEAFVLHMHENHPDLSEMIFQKLFFQSFEKKYKKIKANLFQKIQDGKFNILDNYPFLHYLNEENNLIIEKELSFKVFQRLRYDVLNSFEFNPIFSSYIKPTELVSFYLKYNNYWALVQSIRKDTEGLKIIVGFANRLRNIIVEMKTNIEICENYVFDVLLFFSVLRFNSPNNSAIGDKIIQILTFINNQLTTDENKYHFAILASLSGNILNKNILYKSSVEAKNLSYLTMNKVENFEIQFPGFFSDIDPQSLLFNILTINYMNFDAMNEKKGVKDYSEKIKLYEPGSLHDAVIQLFIDVYDLSKQKNFKKATTKLKEAKTFVSENQFTPFYVDLYTATYDRLDMDIKMHTGSTKEINKMRAKSKGSLAKLYNALVK